MTTSATATAPLNLSFIAPHQHSNPTKSVFFPTNVRFSSSSSIRCSVAIKPEDPSTTTTSSSSSDSIEEEGGKIGARVRVKVPLKVYHVPKTPEIDITGLEGKLKQYVGLWKGKRISANLPFKIEFVKDIDGRGPVKFVAHLKDDEFEYIQED